MTIFINLSGLTLQANMYYKMLINWTSQKVKHTYATRNAFDFKHGNSRIEFSVFKGFMQYLLSEKYLSEEIFLFQPRTELICV